MDLHNVITVSGERSCVEKTWKGDVSKCLK